MAGATGSSNDSPLPELSPGRRGVLLGVAPQDQRERLLAGTIKAVEERGFAKVVVADIIRRTGTYRQIFYENFANKEECVEVAFGKPPGDGAS